MNTALSSFALSTAADRETAPQPPVQLFLHIPKAGGSTLREIFRKQFATGAVFVFPGGYDRDERVLQQLMSLPEQTRGRFDAFMGHFPFGIHRILSRPFAQVTMLRDPIDRSLSDYFYTFQDPGHHPYCHAIMQTREVGLEEFLTDEKLGRDNVQTRYLAGVPDKSNGTAEKVTEEMFQEAKRNLETFAAVGLTERFDESLVLWKRLLGWNNIFYERINITEKRLRKNEVTPDVLRILEEQNRYDIELYEIAKRRFRQLAEAQSGSFADEAARFKILNEEYNRRAAEQKKKFEAGLAPRPKTYGAHQTKAAAIAAQGKQAEAAREAFLELALNPSSEPIRQFFMKMAQTSPPKITFILQVFNGMPLLEQTLKSVYELADEIVVVEGATADTLSPESRDGSSTDGTVSFLEHFPDPSGKLKIVKGFWPEQSHRLNAGLEAAGGDYVWLLDPWEVYEKDGVARMKKRLADEPLITEAHLISNRFDGDLSSLCFEPVPVETPRIFRTAAGCFFLPGPVLHYPEAGINSSDMRVMSGDETRRIGVFPLDYGLLTGAAPDRPADAVTSPFRGAHPGEIGVILREFASPAARRATSFDEELSAAIGDPFYQEKALQVFNDLGPGAANEEEKALLLQNVENDEPYWDLETALCALAFWLKPAQFLALGEIESSSMLQVLRHGKTEKTLSIHAERSPRAAAAGREIEKYRLAAGRNFSHEQIFGDEADRLKQWISAGRKFPLIGVYADGLQEKASDIIEDSLLLMHRDGAIVAGFRENDILPALERIREKYPYLRIAVSRSQKGGCAVIARQDPAHLQSRNLPGGIR